jgi:hypothetical protein
LFSIGRSSINIADSNHFGQEIVGNKNSMMGKNYKDIKRAASTASGELKAALKTFLAYKRGAIHQTELMYEFFQHLQADNVASIADILGESMDVFKKLLEKNPQLCDNWSQVVGTMAIYHGVKEEQESEDEWIERTEQERRTWWARHER